MKNPYNNNKFKILAPTWNDIPVQIFKIILSIFQKKHEEMVENPSIRIYVNKI